MYDRILLPLDGSELAEAVEPHAMAMAKKFESEVILLQVVTPVSRRVARMAPGQGHVVRLACGHRWPAIASYRRRTALAQSAVPKGEVPQASFHPVLAPLHPEF